MNLGDSCGLEFSARELTSANEVLECLTKGGAGWLQTTSAVWIRTTAGAPWKRVSGKGADDVRNCMPLDGELVLGDRSSAALRHLGSTWQWVELHEKPGDSHRQVEVQLVANRHPTQLGLQGGSAALAALTYSNYWTRQLEQDDSPIAVWRPCASLFLGFDRLREDGGNQ